MAQPTNTFSTYDSVGNRENLLDVIYNISPTETPFMSAVGRSTADATLVEWQTDALASASTSNAVIEGDEATTDAAAATVRLGNRCQIMDKVALVSGTQQAIKKAGRKDEMAYQMAKRSKELKRDMEATLLANQARVTGDDTTARKFGAVLSFIKTNTSKGASGADPTGDGSDARTDGTQRALTESHVKTVLQSCFTAGGDPSVVMVGAFNKQQISTWSGNSTRFDKGEDSSLNAAIDVYKSDFGTLEIVPNRFMRSRDLLALDTDMWKLAYLRPFETKDLAISGDYVRKQILVEFTLISNQEAASGGVFDLTTS